MNNFLLVISALLFSLYANSTPVDSCITKKAKEPLRDYRCKFDDGSSFGNINIQGNDSYIVLSSSAGKEFCRPMSSDSRVVVMKCAKSDSDTVTSSLFVLDQDTGDATFAPSGSRGNNMAVISGLKCQGLKPNVQGQSGEGGRVP